GGADPGLAVEVPGAVGAVRQARRQLPRPHRTGLCAVMVPQTPPAPGRLTFWDSFLLVSGESISGAAERSNVSRSTIYRWLASDSQCTATLNATRRLLVENLQAKLVTLAGEAVNVVRRHLRAGNVRVALALLEGLGFLPGAPIPIGPTDPRQVEADWRTQDT